MNKLITVSIIIPAYNVAPYLPECIDSILGQTYKDIEAIVVDDGSTDGQTPKICDHYAAKDSRIKVLHTLNQGVQAARKTGVLNSEGEWLYFLDGDDSIASDTIKSAMELVSEDVCLVSMEDYQDLVLTPQEYGERLLNFNRVNLCGKLYRRDVIADGSVFNLSREFKIAEDLITNVRCLKNLSGKIVVSSLKKYTYRVVQSSVTHTIRITPEYDLKVMEQVLKAVEKTPLDLRQGSVVYQTGILKHLIGWNYTPDPEWVAKLKDDAKGCRLNWMQKFVLKSTDVALLRPMVKPLDIVYRVIKKSKKIIRSKIG